MLAVTGASGINPAQVGLVLTYTSERVQLLFLFVSSHWVQPLSPNCVV